MAANEIPPDRYSIVFPFERNFDTNEFKKWTSENFYIPVFFSAVYIIVVFSLKSWMRDRKPYSLSGLLVLWNLLLTIFSFMAFIRSFPEFLAIFRHSGLYGSVCNNNSYVADNVSSFWVYMFAFSKLFEFGDTIFIVLRKQPLIFLHWYHHAATAVYSWFAVSNFIPSSRWYVVTNGAVHTIMYGYYFLRAMHIRVPRWTAMMITSVQIVQLAAGCYVNYRTYIYMVNGSPCDTVYSNVAWTALMYFSYLVLFGNFFYNTYIVKSKRKKRD